MRPCGAGFDSGGGRGNRSHLSRASARSRPRLAARLAGCSSRIAPPFDSPRTVRRHCALPAQQRTLKFLKEVERVGGIEPPASAWKAEVLPLYDTRIVFIIVCAPA